MTEKPESIIVRKEDAVFWMDRHGRWHNVHGPFEHKKLIDYFHRCIGRDEHGYYVSQQRDHVHEKVYFRYEDTALFVFQVRFAEEIELVLNTGRVMALDPRSLYIHGDHLYLDDGPDRIKFSERAMMAMAKKLTESDTGLKLEWRGRQYPIPETDAT